MTILVLQPDIRRMDFALFTGAARQAVYSHAAKVSLHDAAAVDATLDEVLAAVADADASGVELLAIRVPFGGGEFSAPALVNASTMRRLESLVPQDPLHVPALIGLIDCCGRAFPDVPVVLVFETAFFTALPPREYLYGLDPQLIDALGVRRYGYHGLYHEAACLAAGGKRRKKGAPPRILSICLDAQVEVAAVVGRRVVTVTSGATPLEGIPGNTTCGELDPGIVLMLAEKLHWGAEQINAALTQKSGLLGLVGQRVTLEDVFADAPGHADMELARDVVRYRILLACGAGIAAMGGVDRIVFSGQYADVSHVLGPWLQTKLAAACSPHAGMIAWQDFREPLARLVADAAFAAQPRMRVLAD